MGWGLLRFPYGSVTDHALHVLVVCSAMSLILLTILMSLP